MHFRSKSCIRLNFQSLYKKTPLIGKNPILTRQRTAWTTEEEIAFAKGWKVVSENSERGNARKKGGFWVERGNSTTSGQGQSERWCENKGSKASGSSTMNDDALARLVVNEMTVVEVEQREAFIELKMREVECREREIAATEYRTQQKDMKLYLQPYDHFTGEQRLAWDEIRAKIKAKHNLQF
ncbi:hypothetical protein Tco_0411049 [Tanacetum coccineum]